VHYEAQGTNTTSPVLLVGGFGADEEVAYAPSQGQTGQTVTWTIPSEFTHDIEPVENNNLITSEGYYIRKITRSGALIWRQSTPDEERRMAINPNLEGGYVWTVGEGDRIEFRDLGGNLLRSWAILSDGTELDYPYGIQVILYPG
jgi:hypothetical protein